MSITVAIYERDLVAAGACREGVALWRSIAEQSKRSKKGELRVKVTWTRMHLLWFATAYPSFFAWCREKGIVPQTSLMRARVVNAAGANDATTASKVQPQRDVCLRCFTSCFLENISCCCSAASGPNATAPPSTRSGTGENATSTRSSSRSSCSP